MIRPTREGLVRKGNVSRRPRGNGQRNERKRPYEYCVETSNAVGKADDEMKKEEAPKGMDVVRGSMRVGRRTFLRKRADQVGDGCRAKWIEWGAEWHLVRMRQAASLPATSGRWAYC